jgi:hypothetical protein
MEIQILNTSRQKYNNLGDWLFIEMQSGKQHATVSVGPDEINVCVHNASNQVWRGTGRRFPSADAAIAAYKTGAVKEMIRLAVKTKAETPAA